MLWAAGFSLGMAGHSKWSKVKRIKGPLDVKRGVAFSKLVKEITVAARIGGRGSSGNPRLRLVIETARAATDNKNRTAADLRLIFSKNPGSLAVSGSVSSPFHQRGLTTVPRSLIDKDRLPDPTRDAGAEDIFAKLHA